MKNAFSRNLTRTALLAVFMCALPALAGEDIYGVGSGRNGPLTLGSGNSIINAYARMTAARSPGDTILAVNTTTGFGGGDLVMIIQTTGITPEPPSGGPANIDLSSSQVGRWELARLSGVTGTTMTMTQPLLYSYAATGAQVVRVPEYTNVTVQGTAALIARPWDGSIGGVLAFLATGDVTISATLTVASRGFRGGQFVRDTTATLNCSGLDQPAPTGAQKGEGIAVSRYGSSHTGYGRVANGAGGGVCSRAGGGGGGAAGVGGGGGNSADGSRPVGGQGGASLTHSALTHMTMGGGGGPGHIPGGATAAGGQGGGIIFIRGRNFTGTGSILADGFFSNNTTSTADGAGGGGGGGTIHMRFTGTASCDPVKVHAFGGQGGSTNSPAGPGGGGGGGRILFQACGGAPLCPLSPANVVGGLSGVQQDLGDTSGAEPGANGVFTLLGDCYSPLTAPVVLTPPNGSSTNNNTPTYTGTLAPPFPAGTQVIIYVDGNELTRVTPDASGNWSFTQPTGLSEGSHTVYAVAVNTAQNLLSIPSNTNTFTVDLTPPPAPVVITPANGSITSDTTPTYTGTAEAGSTVTVFVDGNPVGTTTANASGNWSFTPTAPLAEGGHTVSARATDAAGNTSSNSNTNSFIVDTTPPAAPVVLTPANGSITSNNMPTYTGTAEPGSTVTVIVNGNPVGTTTADGAGNWSYTQPTALADGPHTVRARATDAAAPTPTPTASRWTPRRRLLRWCSLRPTARSSSGTRRPIRARRSRAAR
ncbi:adventurous gliding motility protein AgmC [Hyalangium gracile]|uniref:adventurous gliding motility protein AgmC n=1 Tax=Hyalangium gracile TaxID=394092 RepID=UPI001CC90BAB|nr:Ig-like domain-containing protein [Hyalangium gracile]